MLISPVQWFFMAITFRNSRSLTRVVQTATARALRIIMVLSLWHAPIPWVHVHEIEGPHVERLAALAQHIANFHSHEHIRRSTSLDWHTHLVLPWCLNHQDKCPAEDERDPGSDDILGGAKVMAAGLAAGQLIGQPTTRAFLAGEISTDEAALGQHGALAGGVLFGPPRFRHFFETFGCSVAIRDLVSVRLC